MRPTYRARRWRCARALLAAAVCLVSVPAAADRRARSVDDCTRFTQRDAGDDAVDMTIDSTCQVPLRCRVSWRLTCAPETRRRRATPSSRSVRIEAGASTTLTASAASCRGDSWMLDRVVWSCAVSPD